MDPVKEAWLDIESVQLPDRLGRTSIGIGKLGLFRLRGVKVSRTPRWRRMRQFEEEGHAIPEPPSQRELKLISLARIPKTQRHHTEKGSTYNRILDLSLQGKDTLKKTSIDNTLNGKRFYRAEMTHVSVRIFRLLRCPITETYRLQIRVGLVMLLEMKDSTDLCPVSRMLNVILSHFANLID